MMVRRKLEKSVADMRRLLTDDDAQERFAKAALEVFLSAPLPPDLREDVSMYWVPLRDETDDATREAT